MTIVIVFNGFNFDIYGDALLVFVGAARKSNGDLELVWDEVLSTSGCYYVIEHFIHRFRGR